MSRRFWRLFWKLHGWCGLYCGGFLAFILITGAFAVVCEPLYLWETRSVGSIEPTVFEPTRLSALVETASAEIEQDADHFEIAQIDLPEHDRQTVRVAFLNRVEKRNPFAFEQPWLFKTVFLHPGTGQVLGVVDDLRSIANYLRTLHVRIFAGSIGRNFVGLFGLALLFSTVSGLYILGKFLAGKALWIIRKRNLRLATSDVHKLCGLILCIPALVFAISGFWLGMQGRLMPWFAIERPGEYQREPVLTAAEDKQYPIDYSRILAETAKAYPEMIPQKIVPSQKGERLVQVRGKTPGMVYERFSQSVILDKEDYGVLSIHNTHQSRWQAKLFFLQEGLHFGQFWGWLSRIPYIIVGLLLGLIPLSGYLIYRLRKRLSLRPIFRWTVFSILYSAVMLILVKTQGMLFAMAYGTVGLGLFLLGWIGFALARGLRRRKTT